MIRNRHRYILSEAFVSSLLGLAISAVFVFIVFGNSVEIPMRGSGGLILDSLPQTFMIAFMGTLVPTLLTRRRIRNGTIPLHEPREKTQHSPIRLPENAFVRALVVALTLSGGVLLLHIFVAWVGPDEWPFTTVAVFKSLLGAVLGAVTAMITVPAALRDDQLN